MSAGILRISGVNMGTLIDQDNQEDQEFLTHKGDFLFLEDEKRSERYIKDIQEVIERNNIKYDVWGWKDPLSIMYIERVIEKIRNPYFIIITRDPVATAMRERVENHQDSSLDFFIRKANFSCDLYMRSIEFLSKNSYPALFISYERSLRQKNDLANLFLEFCDQNDSHHDETRQEIFDYITPDKLTGNIHVKKSTRKYRYMENSELISGCASLTDVYGVASQLVNSKKYNDALSVISLFEHVFNEGEAVAPFKVPNENMIIDLFIGSRFISGIAHVNIGEARKALVDLSILSSLFEKYKSERDLPISMSIHKDAKELMERLS